jgi:hypothetical protein
VGERSGGSVLIETDVPPERMAVREGREERETIERASLAITDVVFDAKTRRLLADGRLRAGGTGRAEVTWLCNRPVESVPLSLSLPESGARTLAVSLGSVDLGAHGAVRCIGVSDEASGHRRRAGDGSSASLLRAVVVLSERERLSAR